MGAASERRALLLEADDDYNPFLSVDVNEYLIEEFPTLTAKHRKSVWHLCQNDDDFDYDSIHDQIDDWVYEYAESNPDVVLDESANDDSDSSEESDDEIETYLSVDIENYLQDNYDEIDEEELQYMIELITWKFDYSQVYSQIDDIVTKYNDGEFDDELEDDSEKTPTK
tara:strand:- start:2295 stop:2801 length:507 start_codon:yes stop_codon:yes gene_type:complete